MLVPLEIPPGVFKNGTDLMAKDRWTDASLVRFHEDSLRPIGGWREFKDTAIANVIRSMLGWRANNGDRYIALGTNSQLQILETDGTVSNVTPAALVSGFESATINTGYGGGLYGAGTYGTPRDDASTYTEASSWALDTWGENLVACSFADGKLYEWSLNTAAVATQISSSPSNCEGLLSTAERFLFALGADGNPRKIAWSDREDNTTWTPSATNQAGDIELQTPGGVLQGVRTTGESFILTDVDAHTATFVGGNEVYSFRRVGEACGGISRQCVATANGSAYWMGRRGFFRYDGGSVEPIEADVSDYVFTNINRDRVSHVWSVSNTQFGEIWWFYPSEASTEIDSYVVLNYREGTWNIGMLTRTSGIDQGVFRYPYMADTAGSVYEHEFGYNHGTDTPYAETGPILIGTGDRNMVVTDLIPDEETQGEVTATFKTRFFPNGDEYSFGPYDMSTPTNVRFQGKQVRMRIEGNTNENWRVGIMRLEAKEGSKR